MRGIEVEVTETRDISPALKWLRNSGYENIHLNIYTTARAYLIAGTLYMYRDSDGYIGVSRSSMGYSRATLNFGRTVVHSTIEKSMQERKMEASVAYKENTSE